MKFPTIATAVFAATAPAYPQVQANELSKHNKEEDKKNLVHRRRLKKKETESKLVFSDFTVDAGNKNKVIHSNNKDLDDKNAEEVTFWTRSLQSSFSFPPSPVTNPPITTTYSPTTSSPPTGTPPLLSCGTLTTGSTVGLEIGSSSKSGKESGSSSSSFPQCNSLSDGSGGAIQYKYVNGPFQNLVTLSTCNEGTDFDTKIRVYTGNICVVGNDDDFTCSSGSRSSTVSFFAEALVEYQVVVE